MQTILPLSLFMEANTRNFSRNFNFQATFSVLFSDDTAWSTFVHGKHVGSLREFSEFFLFFPLSSEHAAKLGRPRARNSTSTCDSFRPQTQNTKLEIKGDEERKSETFHYFSCFLSLLTFSFASDKSKQMTLSFVYASSPRHRPVLFMDIPKTETEKSLMGGENCPKKEKVFLPFNAFSLCDSEEIKKF